MSRLWRSAIAGIWREITSAPGTYAWLVVLLGTTILQHSMTADELTSVLGERSTNLHHLDTDPVKVLVTSLFWIDGAFWLPYLVMFILFHAPAERWLGTIRWAIVGLSAHVIATYFSEGLLALAIRDGDATSSLVNVRDVGVSYFLAGVVGVLTYHIAYPWRWLYLGIVVAVFASPLFADITFTEIGHFMSMLVGLAWYPITRNRPRPLWNPVTTVHRAMGWTQRVIRLR